MCSCCCVPWSLMHRPVTHRGGILLLYFCLERDLCGIWHVCSRTQCLCSTMRTLEGGLSHAMGIDQDHLQYIVHGLHALKYQSAA